MSVDDAWQARWGARGVRPIGHELRSTARATWVRFHSLPEAKRYPTSEREYAELLHRHNTVLDELFTESGGRDLLVFSCSWSDSAAVVPRDGEIAAASPAARWMTSVERELRAWSHIYVEPLTWRAGVLDLLIQLTADDIAADVIVAPADLAWLVAPYDGGFDVIAASPAQRATLRERHHVWMSSHPQGL